MKTTKRILSVVLLLSLLIPHLLMPEAQAENTSLEWMMFSLVNEDRARYGKSALTLDPELSRIARIKAEDMISNGYFAHTSPTYGNIRQMLNTFGVSYRAASENIARSRSIQHAEAAFLSSSTGHRQTLLSSAWTKVGIGIAVTPQGFVYVSQVFAR
ncbi:MAG: hypothetical protein IIW08_08495 [Clostridia bacterium]|nr:hypothetical protein [Clostridia bacterium]MBQ5771201.1 hypothetical protein [Clostridia bacterium]